MPFTVIQPFGETLITSSTFQDVLRNVRWRCADDLYFRVEVLQTLHSWPLINDNSSLLVATQVSFNIGDYLINIWPSYVEIENLYFRTAMSPSVFSSMAMSLTAKMAFHLLPVRYLPYTQFNHITKSIFGGIEPGGCSQDQRQHSFLFQIFIRPFFLFSVADSLRAFGKRN